MTWTSEKPTKDGWYWYKGNWTTEPVYVKFASNGRLYARLWDWVSEMHGQWAGPIDPPQEQA